MLVMDVVLKQTMMFIDYWESIWTKELIKIDILLFIMDSLYDKYIFVMAIISKIILSQAGEKTDFIVH